MQVLLAGDSVKRDARRIYMEDSFSASISSLRDLR